MKSSSLRGGITLVCALLCASLAHSAAIDRHALVSRNNPKVTSIDDLSSLSVGNGGFALTVDATGLQTFPEHYADGVPLGTQSQWGWHSFANPQGFTHQEILKEVDFGKGHKELYAAQFKEPKRLKDASDWLRVNPHRLHLGIVGLEIMEENGVQVAPERVTNIDQQLDLWSGTINSSFTIGKQSVAVSTVCEPSADRIASSIKANFGAGALKGINIRLPYPTGAHADGACNWADTDKHSSKIEESGDGFALLSHTLDSTTYYIMLKWEGKALFSKKADHYYLLTPGKGDRLSFVCEFSPQRPQIAATHNFEKAKLASTKHWNKFWQSGGAIDFSHCTNTRAKELERRVVLSQYLMAIQCTSQTPPQESGLTYNTWFGRPHLEMHWWHGVHFALWGRPELLENSLGWYDKVAYPVAEQIAKRQGYKGVRWMKMTDAQANEAPSNVGSYLIWQQPHIIYMAELMYRANPTPETLEKYKRVVLSSAEFMFSFATFDQMENRYILKGAIPAQETLSASTTINSPFELSYWHYAMSVAQQWRERLNMKRSPKWEELIDKLSPLTAQDGLYLAAESATDTYTDIRFTSDHMAVLGALGILPECKLVRRDIMGNTLEWVMKNWNWGRTWGWDYPMTAMCAARLGRGEIAIDALLMDKRTNTYLVSGHNYQDSRLRVYLPGNGGLLTTVAMMCAGWDGSTDKNPGFPKDGSWDVRWEGLKPMP